MRRFPHTHPSQRGRTVVLAALAVVTALAGAGGCAAETGARDGGPAPTLSPPVSSAPLWPDYAPPVPPTDLDAAAKRALQRYLPVKNVTVPAGGLRKLPVRRLLTNDPNVPEFVRAAVRNCPGATCGLRDPVYQDLTADGRDELVVALDEPASGLTLVQVYRASGDTVRPVLISWGPIGLTGETFGTDLILMSAGQKGRVTTRYRWNGDVMTVENPWNTSDDAGAPDPLAPETAAPSEKRPVPQAPPAGPDTGAGPDSGVPAP
ncbi:hypothetical protein GCM10011583_21710 [Streptomyces camponoticapitis]|uniref:Lipoprotein n=1 Tax=Streptomyces camponoticapitis TaxID=1616125 RepID=A0ABQ2E2D6_9ACTN|nr:hypothetical protein [Streptomyces camponoticapitis]GGJ90013.1 hypothetical protein GCM10011583_21710 [Streptomyces camponoticapitis]